MGYNVQGYLLKLFEDFLSIPGCILYVSADKLVQTTPVVIGGTPYDAVSAITSLADGYTYTSIPYGNYRRPILISNYIVAQSDTGSLFALLRSSGKNQFKCLQDGNPCGVYFISSGNSANGNSGISPISSVANLTLGSTIIKGVRYITEGDVADRRRVWKQIGDGVSNTYTSRTQNAILNGTDGFVPCSYGWVNTGNGNANNEKIYANNTLLNQHTNTIYQNDDLDTYSNPLLILGIRAIDYLDVRNYFAVAYNWTGYTESQVLAFDVRVRTLVEQYRATL